MKTVLGVIGGSGVYQMESAQLVREHDILTPFGRPSDPVIEARIGDRTVYFIPRHGKGHRFLPSEVPYRANIFALKTLGVTHLLAISAVGIMQEQILPGDMVVPDQIFDRTAGVRPSTFFGNGIVGHVSFADPFCSEMRNIAMNAAKNVHARVHSGGTYVSMEGPAFSTRAESHFYRSTLAPSVIGMTATPEAKLAREAELSYAIIATATDFDCWHQTEEDVTVEAVLKVLKSNSQMVQKIVCEVAKIIPEHSSAESLSAAKNAILTNPEFMNQATKESLAPLYGKYWS
jgi:5'-methylthioadenosine phosphorylase